MTPQEAVRYDTFVFDGARDLAAKFGQDVLGMRTELMAMGVTNRDLLYAVEDCQTHPDYELENYRGARCDEGVIESLKDCLRPLYGF
jgi:hypothetical protein